MHFYESKKHIDSFLSLTLKNILNHQLKKSSVALSLNRLF